MRKNKNATSEGSFFALSKQIFAKKHLFCSIFQDLQDLRTFSPSLGVAAVHDFSDFLRRRFVVQVACCSFFRGVIVVRNDVSRRDFLRFLFALDIQLFGVYANTFTIAQELAYPGCLRYIRTSYADFTKRNIYLDSYYSHCFQDCSRGTRSTRWSSSAT